MAMTRLRTNARLRDQHGVAWQPRPSLFTDPLWDRRNCSIGPIRASRQLRSGDPSSGEVSRRARYIRMTIGTTWVSSSRAALQKLRGRHD